MNPKALSILQEKKLRVTQSRIAVLDTFIEKERALSHADLEEDLKSNYDRVTIYRTLKTFLSEDVIHKVLDDSGSIKYALCVHEHHSDHHHDHEHIHFKCEKCGKTLCIEETTLPQIQLPEGFVNKEVNLLVQGICNKCN
jgi:Fur family transcriptional regulator, ferric uptake regulator